MDPNEPKDANVYGFMMQMIQEKHGDDIDADFLNTEAERLYLEFGDGLVDYFEPMLTSDQKREFDGLVEGGADKESILVFLTDSITDLEDKIIDVLMQYKDNYMNE